MPKTKKDRLYMIGSIVLAVVILVVAAFGLLAKPKSAPAETPPVPETVIREVEKTVEVEKEITTEILHDGLRDMGILVTGEYYFTEVVSFTKNGTFLGFPVRSGYIISYDGTVTAGIDFSGISVKKDDEAHTVTVTLPEALILTVDVDPESFQLYEEKNSVFVPLSVEDFNDSLTSLENTAGQKAVDRGLLERSNTHAVTIVRNFIASLIDPEVYAIEIKTA